MLITNGTQSPAMQTKGDPTARRHTLRGKVIPNNSDPIFRKSGCFSDKGNGLILERVKLMPKRKCKS